jgi:hypothetical protein
MSQHDRNNTVNRRPVVKGLHPRVYKLAIALAAWLVLSVWIFAAGGVTDYLLTIVSGFIGIAVGLPLILSRVGHNDGAADPHSKSAVEQSNSDIARQMSFRDWADSDFDTWQGRLSGRQAAVQILLPIAAVAFGMTAFGIALHVAEHGGV